MKIAVAKEVREGESRVALVPELVGKLTALGFEVAVEPGAGAEALARDEQYEHAGAHVTPDALAGADVVVSVQPLETSVVRRLPAGTATISFLPAAQALDLVTDLRDSSIFAAPIFRRRAT